MYLLKFQINTKTQFLVELTGIQGKLDAKVIAPSGVETIANVLETAPGDLKQLKMILKLLILYKNSN